MDSKLCERSDFSVRLASLFAGLGVAGAAFGSTIASEARPAAGNAGEKTVAGNEGVRFLYSVTTSWDATSNLCRTSELSRHGVPQAGRRERIPSSDLT